jgi:type II secretory pathway pseudopilin PulG
MELLTVLAIMAILAVGSSLMMGNRQSGAVRATLDELEGVISNAQQAAMATGRDVALVSWGPWEGLRIAYGDATLTLDGSNGTNFITIGESLLGGKSPTEQNPIIDTDQFPIEIQQTVVVGYHYSASDGVQKKASILTAKDDTDKWAKAKGDKNQDISEIVPFTTEMKDVLTSDKEFCRGESESIPQVLLVNGYTKRFNKTVFIKVVTTGSGGQALPNGPMGLIVLMQNSASIFKFYNPGAEGGDGKWRRI